MANEGALSIHPPKENDIILCADGGYLAAQKLGLSPDMIIGDMDSIADGKIPDGYPTWRVSKEKDETDTFLCILKGLELGCTKFLIIGAIGGRFDHTLANLQLMAWGLDKGIEITCLSDKVEVMMFSPGSYLLTGRPDIYLSLLAYTPEVTNLTTKGVQYPLNGAVITNRFPLGISNRITGDKAEISFTGGTLLIILCSDFRIQL